MRFETQPSVSSQAHACSPHDAGRTGELGETKHVLHVDTKSRKRLLCATSRKR